MTGNTTGSFFARIRARLFTWRTEREIYDRLMAHLQGEKNHGYPFATHAEMNAKTESLDVQPLLDLIEEDIGNMPKGFGECFRHIMHRDLHERFRMYEQVARRHVRRSCDPRFVATRWKSQK